MTSRHFAACTLALAVLAVCTSSAVAAPPFPKTYRGTITGSQTQRGDGNTVKASWTIKGVVLRRVKVLKSDADWSAHYKVTAGKIVYRETETGECRYIFGASLPLRTSLSSVSAPFALSQSLFFAHKTTALGLMNVKKAFKTTETCDQPDGAPPETASRRIVLPTLFDPGERVVKLGKRFAAKNGYSDDYTHTTTKWSWVLKP